jgi:hypothetical protein
MVKNSDDRYQTAAAFAEAIDEAVATPAAQAGSAGEQAVVSTAAKVLVDSRTTPQPAAAAQGQPGKDNGLINGLGDSAGDGHDDHDSGQ